METIVLFLWKIIYLIGSKLTYNFKYNFLMKFFKKIKIFLKFKNLQYGLLSNINLETKPQTINYKLRTNEGGYSLIELLTSIAVFVVIMSVNANIFISALKGQQKAIATQNVSDNARYLMEVIAKELRVARIGSFVLVGNSDLSFVSGSEHRFNKNIRFYLNSGNVMFDDDTTDANPARAITSSKNITVQSLFFTINNQLTQPKITVVVGVTSKGTNPKAVDNIVIQTTISPRELNL